MEEMLDMTKSLHNYVRFVLFIALAAAPLMLIPWPGAAPLAQDESAQSVPQTPVIDPVADKLLKSMSATLSSAKTLGFKADINFDQLIVSGQQIQYGGAAQVTLKRPDKVYAEYAGDLNAKKVWYTGGEVTVLDLNTNFYGKLPVPSTLDEAMDTLMTQYGFTLPLSDVLVSDPYKAFVSHVAAGVVIGDSTINGQACKHLAFVEKYIDWQIWISEGAQALPCKLVITYKTLPGGPQYEAEFYDWAINPTIDASAFTPALPEGAEQIEFIKMKANNQ
jgi:hypothetical protein